jgi:hypothetical protein
VLLGAGSLAQRVSRRWRGFAMALVGTVGMVVVGSPYLGADTAGAVALAAGVCLAAAMASGGWFTIGRLLFAVAAAFAVVAGFAALDVFRPEQQRGIVGRFVVLVREGTAGFALRRVSEANFVTAVGSPLTVLVAGCAVFVGFVLMRHWGGLKRLFGLYPAVRAALAGTVVATVFAGLVEAVGFNVLGAALATAVPLTALASLRVLGHADDRTPVVDPSLVDHSV